MSRRPLIGITPTPSTSTYSHGTFYAMGLSDTYVKAVWQGGGNPIIIPWASDTPADMLDELDGLILSGGGDIDPARYGEDRHEKTDRVDNDRDAFELALMQEAAVRDVPTLAICRGIQIMGVAFGGSMVQHLPDVSTQVEHRQQEIGLDRDVPSHPVRLENTPNPLSELLGATDLMVNSFHHQALANVPDPLRIAGRSEDGVIEAIWHTGMTFGIGVQWHPEMLAPNDPLHAKLFTGLVEAAKAPAAI